ncbi:MAG: hypothetical protein RLZZ511_583 [Cyanobacteriota bacterium]|jgi:Protein of unknown function (DUF3177)
MQVSPWMATAVWTNFRLAVVFAVVVPLVLLTWSFLKQSDGIYKLMQIYWRVASLLGITVYLLIGALPIGFLSGWLALLLIPASLWFWVDINDEIRDLPNTSLKLLLTSWRWAMTAYCAIGAIFQLSVLRCAFTAQAALKDDATCSLWLQPPWGFREIIHNSTKPWFLGTLGIIGLIVYGLVFSYFVFFRMGKVKRTALMP